MSEGMSDSASYDMKSRRMRVAHDHPAHRELAVGLAIGIMRRIAEADRTIRAAGFEGWRPRLYGRPCDYQDPSAVTAKAYRTADQEITKRYGLRPLSFQAASKLAV